MQKIALVTSIRINSGSGYRIAGIAKYLSRGDFDVVVSGIGDKGQNDLGRARYRPVDDIGGFVALSAIMFVANLAMLLREKPAAVLVSKPLPSSYFPARLYALLSGAKLVIDIDDIEHDYWRSNLLFRTVLRFVERCAVKHVSLITTHSRELQRYLQESRGVAEEGIFFLPQGIDPEIFSGASPDASLEKTLGLSGKKAVVYAAHFNVAASDFEHMLEIFKEVSAAREDAVLLVIGDGPGLSRAQEQAAAHGLAGRVRFAGAVPHDAIGRYFALAHVAVNYLSPTLANRCRASIKVREYLACGLHVVTTDTGSDTGQFREYVHAVAPDDRKGFAAALCESLSEKKTNEAGRNFVLGSLAWKTVLRPFVEHLARCGITAAPDGGRS